MHSLLRFAFRAVAACALLAPAMLASAQLEIPHYLVMSDGRVLSEDDKSLKQTLPEGDPHSVVQSGNMRFNIFYLDPPGEGFRDAQQGELRQARFEEAAAYLAQVLGANGTLDVLVEPSLNLNNGTLASAGTFFRDIDGYQNGNAHQRIVSGQKPRADHPEVVVEVNFSDAAPYHIGSGAPPLNRFDLQSVLLHEMIHAMGFLSLADPDGTPPDGFSNKAYTVYDSFLVRRPLDFVLFPTPGNVPVFAGSAGDLVSNSLGFNGPLARAAFGSVPPIFSPNPFQFGSSLSHWETNSIPGGAVMEHAFAPGEVIRQLPPFEAQALRDLGWLNVNTNNLSRAPSAAFEVSDTTPSLGEQVQFRDLSFSGSKPITSWQWNFGDGTTSNQPNPVKVYNTPGSKTVSLTVTSAVGADTETRNAIIQVAQGPTANFTAQPTSGPAPLQVSFTDTSSGNGATITARQWVFGDGATSNAMNPVHVYTQPGTYTVSLTVTAANGSDTRVQQDLITVTGNTDPEPDSGGCSGSKATDGKGAGDALVSSAMVCALLLLGYRRKR